MLVTGILHEDAKAKHPRETVLQTINVSMIKEMMAPGGYFGYRTELRIIGRDGHWYRVRVSGRLRTWKRDSHRVELPVKYGMYENILLTSHDFDTGRVAMVQS